MRWDMGPLKFICLCYLAIFVQKTPSKSPHNLPTVVSNIILQSEVKINKNFTENIANSSPHVLSAINQLDRYQEVLEAVPHSQSPLPSYLVYGPVYTWLERCPHPTIPNCFVLVAQP